ncbi:hypothetical protein [Tabrizicola sp.]|uniref:hypothetical protein n=1 Tax=Tabrizicola sp. TaxID=2005166 RepID=UPI0035ADE219
MNGFGRLLRRIIDRMRIERGLAALPADGAADFGSTAGDLAAASRMKADVPERMGRMAEKLGAAEAFAGVDRYRVLDMARECDRCGARRICGHVLYEDGGADPADFCPNAANYRELVAGQA